MSSSEAKSTTPPQAVQEHPVGEVNPTPPACTPGESKKTEESKPQEGQQEGEEQPERSSSKLAAGLATAGAPVFMESDNVIELIKKDHREAENLYEQYKNTDAHSEKLKISNTLIRALVSHDECEQLVVYPLLAEKVGNGDAKSYHDISLNEHQEQRELLYAVKQTDITKNFEEYDTKLKKAMEAVLHHVKQEEEHVLPLLEKGMTEEELKKVGGSFRAHKPLVPTQPHPDAPQTGLPAAIAGVMLKPFDIIRDFMEK